MIRWVFGRGVSSLGFLGLSSSSTIHSHFLLMYILGSSRWQLFLSHCPFFRLFFIIEKEELDGFANRWNQGNFKYMEINKILFHLNMLYYLKDSDREILCPLDHLSPITRMPMTVKPKPGAWKLMCLPISVPPPRVCTRRKLALEA